MKKQNIIYIFNNLTPKLVAQRSWQGFPASASWVQALAYTPVILAVPYLSIGLAGCSVGLRISRGMYKLAWISRVFFF